MKIVAALLLMILTSCAHISESEAIKIATSYAKENYPELEISRPNFSEARPHNGGGRWVVGFAVPAPKDENGKSVGVRPWIYDVWVKLDGTAYGGGLHTP